VPRKDKTLHFFKPPSYTTVYGHPYLTLNLISAPRHMLSMTQDNPNIPNPQLPLMATSLSMSRVDRPADESERDAPLVPPGLADPHTRSTGTAEPVAHATRRQLEDDSGESEKEDENEPFVLSVEEQLLPIWIEENITSGRRQRQLINRARSIIANYIEKLKKYDVVNSNTRDEITVATAARLAKTYVKNREAKVSSEASTPMSFKSDHLELPPSTLGLFLDTEGTGAAHTEEVTDLNREDGETHDPSTSTEDTRCTVHPPAPQDWPDRVSAQRARNEDIRKHQRSSIPDQGVVFVDRFPWDSWAASSGQVKEEDETSPGGIPPPLPPKDRPSVVIQSPKSRMINPTCHSTQPDPLVSNQPQPNRPPTPTPIAQKARPSWPVRGPSTIPEPKPPPPLIVEEDRASTCQWHQWCA